MSGGQHPVPDQALTDTGAILGRTGSGKTHVAQGLAARVLRALGRMIAVDPTGVWWGLRSSADGKSPAFSVAVFGGMHADVPITEASAAPLAELLAGQNLPAIVDVSEFTHGGRTRFMTEFLDVLYRLNKTPLTLFLDEADLFAPQRPMPDQNVMFSRVEQIVRRGRVRGFRPWLITQRPAELHKSVLSQASTLIAMRMMASQDRDAVGAWIEGQADRAQEKKVLADLPRLKTGEGYVWAPSHDVLLKAQFPRIKTFDSSRTPEPGDDLSQVELAAVDLSAISASLRDVETAREREDPKALRAQIGRLQAELQRAGAADPAAIGAARHEGFQDGYDRAVADIKVNLRPALERALEGLQSIEEHTLSGWSQRPAPSPNEEALGYYAWAKDQGGRLYNLTEQQNQSPAPPLPAAPAAPPKPSLTGAGGGGTGMPKAVRQVLAALAQYPGGRTKNQVAILAGYAINGGGFNNALSSARTNGWITRGEPMAITSDGLLALGAYEPLPRGRALLQHWLGQLDKAPRKCLEALAQVYPRTLTKTQLGNAAGYEPGTGGFNNALSKLRTLELIQGARGGELKASDEFFQ